MAFVSDFTEEDLQRALAASNPVASGPAGASGAVSVGNVAAGSPAGRAASAPGAQGTGFVNLSKYYDANSAGAGKQASSLMDTLKVDTAPIGESAANSVLEPTRPATLPYVMPPNTPPTEDGSPPATYSGDNAIPAVPQPIDPGQTDAQNASNASDYERALSQHTADMERARSEAVKNAQGTQLDKATQIVNDPNKLRESMNAEGRNPSAFDTYLTGSALGPAYQGLRDFYGYGQSRTNPAPPPDPLQGRNDVPGRVPSVPRGTARPGPSAAQAMDPQLRKRQQGAGGW
jgi:hypothetical protein